MTDEAPSSSPIDPIVPSMAIPNGMSTLLLQVLARDNAYKEPTKPSVHVLFIGDPGPSMTDMVRWPIAKTKRS